MLWLRAPAKERGIPVSNTEKARQAEQNKEAIHPVVLRQAAIKRAAISQAVIRLGLHRVTPQQGLCRLRNHLN
jgi:hypothetical protein